MQIPFNNPSIEGSEIENIRTAIENGHSSAKGPFSTQVTSLLQSELSAADVLLTTSCTAALELSGLMLDIRPGDTVLVPSFTFVTTALAYARAGAQLVFADIDPTTLGIDPDHVADLIDDSTRAVVAVHYAGIACDLAGLQRVLENHQTQLIEDNAHGLFATLDSQPLGSFGRFSTLSFHETKNFVCGEGGALVVNRPEDVDRAHILYDKGTNRRAFMRGQVDKYTWVDDGSSFGLSDILAAYLLGQLEARTQVMGKRKALYERYETNLAPSAQRFGYRLPLVPPNRTQGYHMFYVLLPDRRTRDVALAGLNERGYKATFHYVPLHDSAGAAKHLARKTDCPVTEDISGRLIRLPFFNNLPHESADEISECLLEILEAHA